MTLITDLPLELLFIIIEYLDDDRVNDGSSFASVNRKFSRILLKKARKIAVGTNSRTWANEVMRSKLLQMIENSYNQLSFWNNSMDDFDSILSLVGVKSLTFRESCKDQLSLLTKKVEAKQFLVKDLIIYTIDDWPNEAIPCLESLLIMECDLGRTKDLNIPAYTSLRSLKLGYCMNLEDVSCLDGVHDLHLEKCPKIRDISTLNNNYRVTINSCSGIMNYSRSFHSSRSVRINNGNPSVVLSLENCHSLSSLIISTNIFTFSDIYMKSLRFLHLSAVDNVRSLPPNHLQKVDISYCDNFRSLENMDNIRSIGLTGLNLTSLDGLGPKNQIIRLNKMDELEDISAIKEATTVNIMWCPNTLDTIHSSLLHAEELSIYFEYFQEHTSIPYIKLLKRLDQLQELKVLKLHLYFGPEKDRRYYYSEVKELIYSMVENIIKFVLRNVEKFVLSGEFSKMNDEEFDEEFLVTKRTVESSKELMLLRKSRK